MSASLRQDLCSYQILTQLFPENIWDISYLKKKKWNEYCESLRSYGKCRIGLLLGCSDRENISLSWHTSTYPDAPCLLDADTVIICADQDDI